MWIEKWKQAVLFEERFWYSDTDHIDDTPTKRRQWFECTYLLYLILFVFLNEYLCQFQVMLRGQTNISRLRISENLNTNQTGFHCAWESHWNL